MSGFLAGLSLVALTALVLSRLLTLLLAALLSRTRLRDLALQLIRERIEFGLCEL